MDEVQFLINLSGWAVAVLVIIEKMWKGSRAYATEAACEKRFNTLNERINNGINRFNRHDELIHKILVVQAESNANMKHFGESLDRLNQMLEQMMTNQMHWPQCSVASDTPRQQPQPGRGKGR